MAGAIEFALKKLPMGFRSQEAEARSRDLQLTGSRRRGFLSRNLDFDRVTLHAVQGVSQGDGKDGSQQVHVEL